MNSRLEAAARDKDEHAGQPWRLKEKLTPGYIRQGIGVAAHRAGAVGKLYATAHSDPHGKLNLHHGARSLFGMEGFMRKGQAEWMQQLLLDSPGITKIVEIGFNAGHSSYTFLQTRPDTSVVSFDLGRHSYISKAQDFINKKFPNRHTLIVGDSNETVPSYSGSNPGIQFDLLFIDGGHQYATAKADIENMRSLAAENHVLIVDDYMPHVRWGMGPAAAWDEAVSNGSVMQEAIVSADNRTWAVGRYIAQ